MMRNSKHFALGAATLLLSTAGFTACSSEDTFTGGSFSGESVKTQFAINVPAVGKSDARMGRTRQTLWSAVQMLTQKLCCQTIHDCPKVVPLHYESE